MYFFTRAEATMPTKVSISNGAYWNFGIRVRVNTSIDEGNPFSRFFKIYTSDFTKKVKLNLNKPRTPAGSRSDINTGARLRNFYKISTGTIYYKNIETFLFFNYFHQVSQTFSKSFCIELLMKKINRRNKKKNKRATLKICIKV